jgi:hypothetical protein
MRFKYFFITVIIFAVAVFGQSRVDTSNIGLVLKISLQRDTIWIGEPLILTSTLINKTSKPIKVPAHSSINLQQFGFIDHILVEPLGKIRFYKIIGSWLSVRTDRIEVIRAWKNLILAGDSIYFRELLWLENFDGFTPLESFPAGNYRIILKYNLTNKIILSDSISFVMAYNSDLIKSIKPIQSYLRSIFLGDEELMNFFHIKRPINSEVKAESFYVRISKIRKTYIPFAIYADFLLPTIASLTQKRVEKALLLADEFMKKYTYSPLSEEMAFIKGRLIINEFKDKPELDSVIEEWLKPVFKKYPKNAYRFAFGDIWKKFE